METHPESKVERERKGAKVRASERQSLGGEDVLEVRKGALKDRKSASWDTSAQVPRALLRHQDAPDHEEHLRTDRRRISACSRARRAGLTLPSEKDT